MPRVFRGRRRGRVALIGVAGLLAAGLIWGLTGAFAESASPPAGKVTLRVGWTNRPDNLNPFIGYESSSYEIWHLNYDLLFGFQASDVQPAPELAAEIPTTENGGISADGKTVTVKLRQGVKWHDGEPFTADDVVFTWNYIVDNELSAFTMYTTYVKNVQVVDDYTVQFNLEQPKANIPGMWIPVLPEHIWSKVTPKAAENSFDNNPPIVGTGPFQTVSTENSHRTVVMEANKDYWRGAPKIDEIIFQSYENSNNMASELMAGGLQAAWNIPNAQFESVDARPELEAISYNFKGFDELAFNCYTGTASLGNPVLRDPKFRQALNWAVNTEEIVQKAYLGFGNPATSIIQSDYYPADLDYHWEPPADQKYTFDLEKAKQALDAAGYTDTNGDGVRDYKGKPIELRLWARSESTESQTTGRLLTDWFRSIGLRIDYEVMDDGVMSDKLYNYNKADEFAPDFDMFLWGWGGDVDPTFILSVFLTDQIESWSDCAWSNATYDRLFLEQASELDPQKRKEIIWEMQKIVYEESPYIPLTYAIDTEAYNVGSWTSWVRSPEGKGGAFYTADNIDSYLFVQPAAAEADTSGGGSNTGLIVGIVVAVIVVVGIIVWLVRRG
ncbi:MAG TPA: ABC transporter substrate-binding protein, partial [Thermoleophilia bacterium]|nr:ABC transporter substrate-binding protein [Thermoleophilia bacterium]